jgi:archaellum component FlaC
MQLFNCQVHEISNHINTLPQQIKQQIEQLLQNKQHATNEIIELKNKLESNKNELVPFYL